MASHVFKGPNPDINLFKGSLGEYVYQQLKSHHQSSVLQVDGLTGEEYSVCDVLQDGLRVAAGLRARGVGPNDVVILSGNYSRSYFAALLGAILQNTSLFPVNPSFRQREMEAVIQVARPKIVFADNEPSYYITAALESLDNRAEVVLLTGKPEPTERIRSFQSILGEPDGYQVSSVEDPTNDIAVYMHSSGTTGLPKVIAMPHKNVIYNVQVWKDIKVIKEKCVNLQATLGSWIIGFLLTLKSYVFGFKRVYVYPNTAENLVKVIETHRPDWVVTMPFSLQEILLLPNLAKYDVSSLKYILIGGCPPMKGLHKLFHEKWRGKGVILGQTYGSTELSYYNSILTEAPYESAGRIATGMTCKVVDQVTGKALGPNETGEVRIKSVCPLIKCYAGRPKDTEEAFDAEGFYITGDVGTITADNLIYIDGRLKDYIQTKSGRVTPWVLEDYIMNMGGIQDVAVVGIPNEDGSCLIAAAVILLPDSPITAEKIHEYIHENFSKMNYLTGGIRFVKELPRNSNGKLEREKVLDLFTSNKQADPDSLK